MSVLPTTNPTMADYIKALSPEGGIDVVAEILNETNEILDDLTFVEGNLPTGHRSSIRLGLPTATWRVMYGGVQPTKSLRATITDSTGMLEAYAEVDKALADLNGNTNEFRLSEDYAHIEGMSQTVSSTLFYGNEELNPERFTGFAPRFNTITGVANAENIVDAGGTGTDNASIWLIGWSPRTVHGIFPKGSMVGLQKSDKGQVTIEAAPDGGGRFEAYRTHYRWDLGLTVKDWRYVVRICNIDRSLLNSDASGSSANLPELMFEAQEIIPNLGAARFAWYTDRGIRTKIRQQIANGTSNSTLMWEDVGGKKVMSVDGIPLRRVDSLNVDEARIV